MIAILSIPHSGTHFLKHLLAAEEPYCSHIWPHRVDDYDGWLYEANRCEHVIVPLRHPYAIARSWKRRGKDLEELARYWGVMENVVDTLLEPLYLPIDTVGCRVYHLQQISDALGRPLSTDWSIIREDKDNPQAELTRSEQAAIPLRRPFTQFYGSNVVVGNFKPEPDLFDVVMGASEALDALDASADAAAAEQDHRDE